ncbi:DUF3093 domain-containing protein [Subtercola boreus]|uniref:DUF3093 domain-containing protein n=1 Tax=Subtercola boreus TaxID=120213 RepID=A0A3E0W9Z9_9MICO|nr:DUF3093 domain-containing protein [Subtercola boreus]RFA20871.1 hypothetical protein B7R23_08195 [Subtercola boreus]RFA20987.1 hypothetical protein B7R24_08255 [Subtercola boreus]RFA27064.1 hypothetical protein B7R25_08320 [Subtercola boreus]
MATYRERLSPPARIYLYLVLLIPASILVFAPINMLAGIVCAIVLYGGSVLVLFVLSPVVTVGDGMLVAGRARIPLSFVGEPEAMTGGDATMARGQRLDARAWLCIRGWIQPVVRVSIHDPEDPVPYWLISSRNPKELVAALQKADHELA